jgi:predicted DNA-binding transcriptional regulator YafY
MASTSSRTLQLLSLLQTHRYWPGAVLAERLDVSGRTLRRDIDRLRELGYPVEAVRGVDGGYQLAAGAALPPLVLDDEEAVAIVVGLQAAAQGSVAGVAESSVRALTKVVHVMPPRLRRQAEALRAVTVAGAWNSWNNAGLTIEATVLTTIAQACRDTQRLQFRYAGRAGGRAGGGGAGGAAGRATGGAAGGERTDRLVDPHRLVSLGRRWYLVAWDLTRHDWRTFRVDRMDEPKITRERFNARSIPGGDAAAFVRAGIESVPQPHTVEVLVHAPAVAIRARIGPWATVTPEGSGRCRVRMTTDSLDWPAMALGSIDAEFEVVTPAELVAHLQEWSARFARAVAGVGAGGADGGRAEGGGQAEAASS